jgi:hypothetical protein
MCFSFEVSLGTGIFSWITGLYVLSKKNISHRTRIQSLFLLIFSLMQFADAILWFINMKKNNINYIVTSYLIPFLLSLQALFNIYYVNKYNNIIANMLLLIGIPYLFYRFNGYSVSSCSNKLSSPIWGNNELELWEILAFLIMVSFPNVYEIIGGFTIIYGIKLWINGGVGSMWCAIANLLAIKLLLTS